jgi:hypothetical protein
MVLSQNVQHNLADALGLYGDHDPSHSAERNQAIMAFWKLEKEIRVKELLSALTALDKGGGGKPMRSEAGPAPRTNNHPETASVSRTPDPPQATAPGNGKSALVEEEEDEEELYALPKMEPLEGHDVEYSEGLTDPAYQLIQGSTPYDATALLEQLTIQNRRLEILEGMVAESVAMQELTVNALCLLMQFSPKLGKVTRALPKLMEEVEKMYKEGKYPKFMKDVASGRKSAAVLAPPEATKATKATDQRPPRKLKGK